MLSTHFLLSCVCLISLNLLVLHTQARMLPPHPFGDLEDGSVRGKSDNTEDSSSELTTQENEEGSSELTTQENEEGSSELTTQENEEEEASSSSSPPHKDAPWYKFCVENTQYYQQKGDGTTDEAEEHETHERKRRANTFGKDGKPIKETSEESPAPQGQSDDAQETTEETATTTTTKQKEQAPWNKFCMKNMNFYKIDLKSVQPQRSFKPCINAFGIEGCVEIN